MGGHPAVSPYEYGPYCKDTSSIRLKIFTHKSKDPFDKPHNNIINLII